jgi:hypothetical protein
MRIRSALKTSTLGVAALFAMSMTTIGVSYADTFDLTSCHISTGCPAAGTVFGTVALTQTTATTVLVDVVLNNGSRFVETGAGGDSLFLFNDSITGSTITGISATLNGAVVAIPGGLTGLTNQSPIMADGTGTFTAAVQCTTGASCNGGSTPNINDLHFTVTAATIAALTTANANGNIFVADILCGAGVSVCGGLTGPVDVSGVPSAIPIPGALPLFITGLAGLVLVGRRRKKQAAASAA